MLGYTAQLKMKLCIVLFLPLHNLIYFSYNMYFAERESGPPKYRPLLENVDAELAAKLDSLSNPKTGAEKLRKGRSFTKNSSTLSSLSKKKSSSSLSKSFSVSSRTKH